MLYRFVLIIFIALFLSACSSEVTTPSPVDKTPTVSITTTSTSRINPLPTIPQPSPTADPSPTPMLLDNPDSPPAANIDSAALLSQVTGESASVVNPNVKVAINEVDAEAVLASISSESAPVVDLNARTEGRDTMILLPNEGEYLLGLKNVPEWSKLIVDGKEIKPTHLLVEDKETFSSIPRGTTSAQLELVNHQIVDISSKLPTKEPESNILTPKDSDFFQFNGVKVHIIGAVLNGRGWSNPKYYTFNPNPGDNLVVISVGARAKEDLKLIGLSDQVILIDANDTTKQYKTMGAKSVSNLPNGPNYSALDIPYSVPKGFRSAYVYFPKADKLIKIKGFFNPGGF